MPKYAFRLQKVMEAKKRAEDRRKQELAQAERVLGREQRVLRALRTRGEGCRKEILDGCEGAVDLGRESMSRARFAGLMRDVERQHEAVDASRRGVGRNREALVECAKERKILENLKEKGLLEHMRHWLRREQKETDEIGRDVFLRRTRRVPD
jgi:flagellar export protein FliJ